MKKISSIFTAFMLIITSVFTPVTLKAEEAAPREVQRIAVKVEKGGKPYNVSHLDLHLPDLKEWEEAGHEFQEENYQLTEDGKLRLSQEKIALANGEPVTVYSVGGTSSMFLDPILLEDLGKTITVDMVEVKSGNKSVVISEEFQADFVELVEHNKGNEGKDGQFNTAIYKIVLPENDIDPGIYDLDVKVDLNIYKVEEGSDLILQGAEFKIEKIDSEGNVLEDLGVHEVAADGSIELIVDINDVLKITEVKAPEGYKKLEEPIIFNTIDEVEHRVLNEQEIDFLDFWVKDELKHEGVVGKPVIVDDSVYFSSKQRGTNTDSPLMTDVFGARLYNSHRRFPITDEDQVLDWVGVVTLEADRESFEKAFHAYKNFVFDEMKASEWDYYNLMSLYDVSTLDNVRPSFKEIVSFNMDSLSVDKQNMLNDYSDFSDRRIVAGKMIQYFDFSGNKATAKDFSGYYDHSIGVESFDIQSEITISDFSSNQTLTVYSAKYEMVENPKLPEEPVVPEEPEIEEPVVPEEPEIEEPVVPEEPIVETPPRETTQTGVGLPANGVNGISIYQAVSAIMTAAGAVLIKRKTK